MRAAARRLAPFFFGVLGACSAGGKDLPDDGGVATRPPLQCGARTVCGRICVDLQTDPESCGACDRTCVVPNALAGCAAGACTIAQCNEGFYDTDHKVENGCEATSVCTAGAECKTSCDTAGRTVCSGGQAMCQPPPESCNARDDDCNGSCDEGALPGCRIGVHRSSGALGHLYTTDRTAASTAPFMLEAADYFHLYSTGVPGTQPVFLCKKPNGKFFLTSSTSCESVNVAGQQLGYWAGDARCGGVPLYRLYHAPSANHFYTLSDAERDNAVTAYGYQYESIAGYVFRGP